MAAEVGKLTCSRPCLCRQSWIFPTGRKWGIRAIHSSGGELVKSVFPPYDLALHSLVSCPKLGQSPQCLVEWHLRLPLNMPSLFLQCLGHCPWRFLAIDHLTQRIWRSGASARRETYRVRYMMLTGLQFLSKPPQEIHGIQLPPTLTRRI